MFLAEATPEPVYLGNWMIAAIFLIGAVCAVVSVVLSYLAYAQSKKPGKTSVNQPLQVIEADQFAGRREIQQAERDMKRVETQVDKSIERLERQSTTAIEEIKKTLREGFTEVWERLNHQSESTNERLGELGERVRATEAIIGIGHEHRPVSKPK